MLGRRFITQTGAALATALVLCFATPAQAAAGDHPKLDSALNQRVKGKKAAGTSRVIVRFKSGWDPTAQSQKFGGKVGRRLNLVNGQVLEVPNSALTLLADHPGVVAVHWDRPVRGAMDRTAPSIGARTVQQVLRFNGAGVGVAVIDSGITAWHNDLTTLTGATAVMSTNGQRVAAFVDYVNGQTTPYDDHGHGTHVSGIIAGNGFNSLGVRAGVAPSAHLVSLKVLDGQGRGVISNVIAALDYVVQNRQTYNIRVVNVSVGAAVYESYNTDPLTLAAKRATDAGVVVVAAAGNLGRNALGESQYGGITAPGNAPWVLTVGASSHQGTHLRYDDAVAGFSSRGPAWLDFQAKPDLVAPGVGIVSLTSPGSLLYTTKTAALLNGIFPSLTKPYLSLSGTSMAAPVVAGTVALMVQANPSLTPNLVKAILQYTAQSYAAHNPLTQGAGFLNAKGAVDLARFFAVAQAGQTYPYNPNWSRKVHWGNHRISGGAISPNANAWLLTTVWGASHESDGDNIVWGTDCETENCDNIVWGTQCAEGQECGDNIVWGTTDSDGTDSDGDNIVWGTHCENETCDNIVWGTNESDGDNIVWGTDCDGDDCDNIVWGTTCEGPECGDNIVWGTECEGDGCDNIVWGTDCEDGQSCGDNIVWGTECEGDNCDNIVWGTECEGDGCGDNIVWGTECEGDSCGDNIVWGTLSDDGTTFAPSPWYQWFPLYWSEEAFEWLFITPSPPIVPTDPSDTTVTSIATEPDTTTTTVSTEPVLVEAAPTTSSTEVTITETTTTMTTSDIPAASTDTTTPASADSTTSTTTTMTTETTATTTTTVSGTGGTI